MNAVIVILFTLMWGPPIALCMALDRAICVICQLAAHDWPFSPR